MTVPGLANGAETVGSRKTPAQLPATSVYVRRVPSDSVSGTVWSVFQPEPSACGRPVKLRRQPSPDTLRTQSKPALRDHCLPSVAVCRPRAMSSPFDLHVLRVGRERRGACGVLRELFFPSIRKTFIPSCSLPSPTTCDVAGTGSRWAGPRGCASSLTLPTSCTPTGDQEQRTGWADFRLSQI